MIPSDVSFGAENMEKGGRDRYEYDPGAFGERQGTSRRYICQRHKIVLARRTMRGRPCGWCLLFVLIRQGLRGGSGLNSQGQSKTHRARIRNRAQPPRLRLIVFLGGLTRGSSSCLNAAPAASDSGCGALRAQRRPLPRVCYSGAWLESRLMLSLSLCTFVALTISMLVAAQIERLNDSHAAFKPPRRWDSLSKPLPVMAMTRSIICLEMRGG